jgi:hypothetical protein
MKKTMLLAFLLFSQGRLAAELSGTYSGVIHTYCSSFNYTNPISVLINPDQSVQLSWSSQGLFMDGLAQDSGAVLGLSITVRSLSLGLLKIPYTASTDGEIFTASGNRSGITSTILATNLSKPSVAISSPPPGAKLSNQTVTVTGQANSLEGIAGVWVRLNGLSWQPAALAGDGSTWTAEVTLAPGSNTVEAFALDGTGASSRTNTVTILRLLYQPLLVRATGQGTLTPNLSNAVLLLGQGFTMTAAGVNGHTFSQWQVTTNWLEPAVVVRSNKLNFTMQSNLTLTAVFLDTSRPTVAVTNLSANQRISNMVYTVRGKAGDNVGVSNVWYRHNGGAWALAQGLNPWAVSLQLDQRTNTFQVCAEDGARNRSATSSVSFLRFVTALMVARSSGQGTLSPNYNGKMLELGKSYTMTAAAKPGCVFTGWTDDGGVTVTNKATVSFVMRPNLVLQANFLDLQKPMLTITSPANGARFNTAVATVRGTVSDNGPLGLLWHQYAGSAWESTPATNNWSVGLSLVGGTNWFRIYAVDAAGNVSPTNSRSLVCALPASASSNALKIAGLGWTNSGWRLLMSEGKFGAVVQASGNLVDWTPTFTNSSTNCLLEFLDHHGTNASRRFYRVVLP